MLVPEDTGNGCRLLNARLLVLCPSRLPTSPRGSAPDRGSDEAASRSLLEVLWLDDLLLSDFSTKLCFAERLMMPA